MCSGRGGRTEFLHVWVDDCLGVIGGVSVIVAHAKLAALGLMQSATRAAGWSIG